MAAYRYPGTHGIDPYRHGSLDDGTMARTQTPLPGTLKDLILTLNLTTLAEQAVAAVLISSPVNHVDFRIENILINKTLMGAVQFAILSGKVEVKVGGSGDNFEASYSSWKHHRKTPGKEGKIGEIKIKQDAVAKGTSKSVIFHECVHALKDICNYKMAPPGGKEMHGDEAFAYLAETLFMSASKMKIPSASAGVEGAIFAAATAIIKSKDMLARPGTVLQWSDCDALIKAVKAVPSYH